MRVLCPPRDQGRPRSVPALVRSALDLDWEALIYSGGLENRPGLLRRLERRGAVLGNGSDVVEAVRDPATLFPFLRREGLPHPPTFTSRRERSSASCPPLLWKPERSGGGTRIRIARPRERCPRGFYPQERVRGTPGSASFVAGSGRAALLGVTEQLAGFRELGGSAFRYGGNIAGPPRRVLPGPALAILERAGGAIARHFDLRGLFGVDFILHGGVPYLLEVNPRYTASMELFEDLSGTNLIELHLRALERGPLPRGPLPVKGFLAKGILYASRAVRWVAADLVAGIDVRDRPGDGETIGRDRPICTLVAGGASSEECRGRLVEAGIRVRRALRPVREGRRPAGRRPGAAVPVAARGSVLR